MRIKIVYQCDATTHTDEFTCSKVSSQLRASGLTTIMFRDGPAIDDEGRKVTSVQYAHAEIIYRYVD